MDIIRHTAIPLIPKGPWRPFTSVRTLTYADNVIVGTAKVSIAFIGNYSGTASTSFEINARVVAEDDKTIIIQAIPNQTYTGSEIKPEPVIIDKNR